MRLIPSAFLPGSDEQPATLPPSPTASHLGIVHVPEKAVGLGVQNKVPPQKLATVLILLDVQKPTNSVLPIHIRHSWALLTSPCMAGGREGGAGQKKDPASGPAGTSLWLDSPLREAGLALSPASFPRAPNVPPQQNSGNLY